MRTSLKLLIAAAAAAAAGCLGPMERARRQVAKISDSRAAAPREFKAGDLARGDTRSEYRRAGSGSGPKMTRHR